MRPLDLQSLVHPLRSAPLAALAALAASLAMTTMAGCGENAEKRVTPQDTVDTSFGEVDFEIDTGGGITLPPDFGEICAENDDCVTGFCVEGPGGFVCSKTCVSECPVGWGCKGVQSGSADIVFVCVPEGDPQPDTIGGDTNVGDTGVGDTNVGDTGSPADTTVTDTSVTDTGPSPDTTQPPLGNACEAAPGVGADNLRAESQIAAGDWPDCIVGCDFEVNPTIWYVDLQTSEYTGAAGLLDDTEHLYEFDAGSGAGPDIDIVAIIAPPRTMLELAVLKDSVGASTEPLIYVHDGFQVRTYNSDVSDSNTCARTTIGFPYVSGLPIYAVIEEARNYDRWTPTGYDPGTVGGTGYGWTLRIRAAPFQPIELGRFGAGQVGTLGGQRLVIGGQTQYYRFWAPGTAKPRVTVTRTSGGTVFEPTIAGMKTIADELVWQRVESDGDRNGVVIMGANGFRPCIPQSECPAGFSCPPDLCTAAEVEYIFAVYDYNGVAGSAGYGFDVKVEVE